MNRRGVRRFGAIVGAAGLLVVCATSTGAAAGAWKKPVGLGKTRPDLYLTSADMGSHGDAAAAWYWKQSGAPYAYHVQVATSRDGQGWHKPVSFYAGNHGLIDGPRVVVDGRGTATVLWAEGGGTGDSSHCSVRVVSGKVGGAWGHQRILSTACADSTQLSVDGQGDLVASWQSQGSDEPMYATQASGHMWKAAVKVPNAAGLVVRGLATDRSGHSTIALAGDGHITKGLYAAHRDLTSGWSDPVRVSPAQPRGVPLVAASSKDDVTLMWSAGHHRILTASSQAGGTWSKARLLAKGVPSRVVYAKRTALAVWASPHGASMFSMKAAKGGWKKPENVSGSAKGNQHQEVSPQGHGRLTVVWSNFYTGHIQARTRSTSGHWSKVQTVAAKGYGTSPFIGSLPGGSTWITYRTKLGNAKFQARASRHG